MHVSSFKGLSPLGFHRVVCHEWGDRRNRRVLVCVHGLARNSRDFDFLGQMLARDYRVVCPDIVGRGESDWLPPGGRYEITQYVADMVALLARLDVDEVDWLGTSMGGLIGMALAAQPGTPIRRLILNDIGPFVSGAALTRIGNYVGERRRFASLDEVERYLRACYSAFAGISDAQWRHLARHGARELDDGGWVLHYDPAIGDQTREAAGKDVDLWPLWERISCPRLVLWGQDSDVLEEATVRRMEEQEVVDVVPLAGIGHAPSLMVESQVRVVQDWLRGH